MKKLILSVITLLMFSFSTFSNPVKGGDDNKILIKLAANAVDFLQKELKLKDKDPKLKELRKAYMNYAKDIISINEKIEYKNKSVKSSNSKDAKKILAQNKKASFTMMTKSADKRDRMISKMLSKKQFEKYRVSSKSIHPFSLKIKEGKGKKTK